MVIYHSTGGLSLKSKYSLLGVVSSVGCIILCAIFLFWNPYSRTLASKDMILIIFIMLICPAFIGIINSFLRNRILMHFVFVWSLPYGLYFSVASIPSIWNLFSVVLILYLVSAIRMSKSYSR
jgi:hypothetical protein